MKSLITIIVVLLGSIASAQNPVNRNDTLAKPVTDSVDFKDKPADTRTDSLHRDSLRIDDRKPKSPEGKQRTEK